MGEEEKNILTYWAGEGLINYPLHFNLFRYGMIVAIVELVDCILTEECEPGKELPFGDFRRGRWAWITTNLRPLEPPILYRGHQGLFELQEGLLE